MVRTAVIGVDVGGTKIHAVGMEAQKGPQPLVLFSKQIAAERATPTVFCDRLAHFIQDLINDGRSRGYVLDSHIGLGMPGRYVLDPQGGRVVAPGTAPNLGRTAHDFDGLDPAHELSRRLPECSFSIHNDAVAQMRYALELLLRNEKTTEGLRGQRICYLGPGTGLGGGFAKIRSDGPVDIRTDGHVFDIVVEPSGVTLPVEGGGHRMEIHRLGTAEELVSGKAVAALMAEVDAGLTRNGGTPLFAPLGPAGGWLLDQCLAGRVGGEAERAVALQLAHFEGRMLGRVIEKIYRGDISKTDPRAVWPPEDIDFVRGIVTFILGGSVPRGQVGPVLRESALAELAVRVPGVAFSLLSPPMESGHAGALGAALLAGKISVQ
jgi:predicted NBD/HSP70 family sugar kinase